MLRALFYSIDIKSLQDIKRAAQSKLDGSKIGRNQIFLKVVIIYKTRVFFMS